MILIAQQTCPAIAQIQNGSIQVLIGRFAFHAAAAVGRPHVFAEFRIRGVGHERGQTWGVQGELPFIGPILLFGRVFGGGLCVLGCADPPR
jgi:hypothetical protein